MVNLLKRTFYLLFFCFLIRMYGDLADETVYLTWQRDPLTTMTIQWISHANSAAHEISYRKKGEINWSIVKETPLPFPQAPQYRINRVELIHLTPNSDYEFKLTQHENESTLRLFSTMPINLDKPLSFVEGGDMYHDGIPLLEKMCKLAASTNPSFAVVGGDIAYSVNDTYNPQNIGRWVDWVRTWSKMMITPDGKMIPCLAAIGNHDLTGQYGQTPTEARIFSMLFPLPGSQIFNVLDFGNYLSIFLLDSGHANPIGGKQTAWLKKTLQERKTVPYRFTIYHVPAYPSFRPFKGAISKAIRYYWVPLFEENKITLSFEHHEHTFKRTYPLLKNRVHPNGIIYLGDGCWGVENPRRVKRTKKLFYIAKAVSARHVYQVTLTNEQCEAIAIGENGVIIDQLTVKPLKETL